MALKATLRVVTLFAVTFAPFVETTMTRDNVTSTGKLKLTLAAILNFGGYVNPLGPLCSEAMAIATDAIKTTSLLSEYDLVIEARDDFCDDATGVKLAVDLLNSCETNKNNLVPLIVGQNCPSSVYAAPFEQYYNFMGIADVSPIYPIHSNRKMYNSFFAILPSIHTWFEAIPVFLRNNGWKNVYLLTETWSFWEPYLNILSKSLNEQNMSLAGTSKLLFSGSSLPTPEQFDMAAGDLAAFKPRIVIMVMTQNTVMACYLHHYNLYGPGFVYLVNAAVLFTPTSPLRPPFCTESMLYDVQQSVILYSFASPINMDPNAVDLFGTTRNYLENTLKSKLNNPERSDKWFFWRSACYNELMASALTLDKVEQTLKKSNDSLLNWVTNSENFRRNGSYIHSLLKQTVEDLSFKGFALNEGEQVMAKMSVTAFFQWQESDTVPVAKYDSNTGSFKQGPGKYAWKTSDGLAPYDSIYVFPVKERLIGETAQGVLTGIAVLLITGNSCFIGISFWNLWHHSSLFSNSLPEFNLAIAVGNMILLCAVLVFPVKGEATTTSSHFYAASLLVVFGFTMVSTSILEKMQIATNLASHRFPAISNPAITSRFASRRATPATGNINKNNTGTTIVSRDSAKAVLMSTNVKLSRQIGFAAMLIWSVIQSLLIVIWFELEPALKTVRFDRKLEQSANDVSIQYQHYTYACHLSLSSDLSLGFLSTLIVSYLLAYLRCIYLAFLLKHVSIDVINDIQFIRAASYSIGIVVVAGGAIISSIFASNDPAELQIAISALIIIVSSLIMTIIPKWLADLNSSNGKNERNHSVVPIGIPAISYQN